MKKHILLAVSGFVFFEITSATWQDQVSVLLKAIVGLDETLQSDNALYREKSNQAISSIDLIQAAHQKMQNAAQCAELSFERVNKDLAVCLADNEAIRQKNKDEQLALKSELESLKLKTTYEISRLTTTRNQLISDREALKATYATLVGDAQVTAQNLMDKLTNLEKSYNEMIKSRTTAIGSIDKLIAQIAQYEQETKLTISESSKLCNE